MLYCFDTATITQLPIMLRTAALLSLSATLASCQYAAAAPTVQVKNGSYVGVHSTEYDQDFFLGVPFAQPPVGNLRYRNPVGLNQSWTDVKPATAYSTEVRTDRLKWQNKRQEIIEHIFYIQTCRLPHLKD